MIITNKNKIKKFFLFITLSATALSFTGCNFFFRFKNYSKDISFTIRNSS